MSDMKAFKWRGAPGIAADQDLCEWNGFLLWATEWGDWQVVLMRAKGKVSRVVMCDRLQARGTDLEDAKRRAQASAMVYYQLQPR